jgi:hypothetical protein
VISPFESVVAILSVSPFKLASVDSSVSIKNLILAFDFLVEFPSLSISNKVTVIFCHSTLLLSA